MVAGMAAGSLRQTSALRGCIYPRPPTAYDKGDGEARLSYLYIIRKVVSDGFRILHENVKSFS